MHNDMFTDRGQCSTDLVGSEQRQVSLLLVYYVGHVGVFDQHGFPL